MQRSLQLFDAPNGSKSLEPALGQACDQCRRRKSRCNRAYPCVHCDKTGQLCSYNQAPLTRGRKPKRRPVIRPASSALLEDETDPPVWIDTTFGRDQIYENMLPVASLGTAEDASSQGPLTPALTFNRQAPSRSFPTPVDDNGAGAAGSLSMSDGTNNVPWTDATVSYQSCHISPNSLETMETFQLPPTPVLTLDWQSRNLTSPTATATLDHIDCPPSYEQHCWCGSGKSSSQSLDRKTFIPYVHLFFERLYVVFPVIEKAPLLAILEAPQSQHQRLPQNLYAFFTALSAAVLVQLDLGTADGRHLQDSPGRHGDLPYDGLPQLSPDLLVAQCLQARREGDIIEDADEWTILASFFLTVYYCDAKQTKSAWYYLREAIGFAQSLGLDDPLSYASLDAKTSQRRRLLFWLLFVTERGLALIYGTRATLQQTIDLPSVFESQEPKLMYGFVTLARVFSAVDIAFVAACRTKSPRASNPSASDLTSAFDKLLREDAEVDALAAGEINETQRSDIAVTQQWLRTLAWQLQLRLEASRSEVSLQGAQSPRLPLRDTSLVIRASKSLVDVVSSASDMSLNVHGVGMEHKVSVVAHCLCDVLEAQKDKGVTLDFFSSHDVLNRFLLFLANYRGRESQYLQPLLRRASGYLLQWLEPQKQLSAGERPAAWEGEEAFLDGLSEIC